MCIYCQYCVLSGRGLYDGLIFRPEMSYECVCVCVCVSLSVIICNDNPLHVQSVGRMGQIKK